MVSRMWEHGISQQALMKSDFKQRPEYALQWTVHCTAVVRSFYQRGLTSVGSSRRVTAGRSTLDALFVLKYKTT